MTATTVTEEHTPSLSRWIKELEGSPTMALHSKAMMLRRQGRDIVNLTAGEPDFDTPEHIRAAAKLALDEGKTHYTPTPGIPELREAVAEWASKRTGKDYKPDGIVVTPGGKFAIYGGLATLVNPGDEVLTPAPYWVSYPPMVRMFGGKPVRVWAGPDQGFKVTPADLERKRTARTRGLIFNSPSNPTGAVYSEPETRAIARWAAEHDVWIISDEIYAELRYSDEPYCSIVGADERPNGWQVLADGLSKSHAMTGWRLGVLASSPAIAAGVSRLAGQSTSCASSITQYAALAAFTGPQDEVRHMADEFRKRRDSLGALLKQIPELGVTEPQGAFYYLLDVQHFVGRRTAKGESVTSSEAIAAYLLDAEGLAVMPGEGFGAPGFIRLSFATSPDVLREAASRLKRALAALA
jgi:aspartate aminotransferase